MSSRVLPAADLAQGPTWFPSIDYIKALAIIAVVFTHAGLDPWSPSHTSTDRLLCQGWVDFHVTSFILVAGFLAARSGRMDARALGRRLVRILCPYLLASLVVQATGVSAADGPGEILYELATGGSLGIYYFVFLIFVFALLSWPMSRAGRNTLEVLLVVVCAYDAFATLLPSWAVLPSQEYWRIRNPISSYPYFLIGWVSFLNLHEIGAIHRVHKSSLRSGAVAAIVVYVIVTATRAFYRLNAIFRSVYTLGVVTLITSRTAARHRRLRSAFSADPCTRSTSTTTCFRSWRDPMSRTGRPCPGFWRSSHWGLRGARSSMRSADGCWGGDRGSFLARW